MYRHHRDLIRRLQKAGVTVVRTEMRSSTFVLHCMLGESTIKYFASCTPSDKRAMDNALHDVLRELRKKELHNVLSTRT